MKRAMVAALAAAMVVSGCATGDGESDQVTTTSSAAAEPAGNPWDLPLEQRPPLFDPCAEIPIEAVSEGAGKPVEPDVGFRQDQPGELMTCGWKNGEVRVTALSTWKSHSDYVEDPASILGPEPVDIGGREAIQMYDRSDLATKGACHHLFFTEVGTVILSIWMIDGLDRFRGELFSESCDVLEVVEVPLVNYVPKGDFR